MVPTEFPELSVPPTPIECADLAQWVQLTMEQASRVIRVAAGNFKTKYNKQSAKCVLQPAQTDKEQMKAAELCVIL